MRWDSLSQGFTVIRQRVTTKLEEGWFYIRDKEEILHYKSGKALTQVAQSCGCPIPARNGEGQVGWGFEQSDLVKGVPAYSSGVGAKWTLELLPTKAIVWFSWHNQTTFSAYYLGSLSFSQHTTSFCAVLLIWIFLKIRHSAMAYKDWEHLVCRRHIGTHVKLLNVFSMCSQTHCLCALKSQGNRSVLFQFEVWVFFSFLCSMMRLRFQYSVWNGKSINH